MKMFIHAVYRSSLRMVKNTYIDPEEFSYFSSSKPIRLSASPAEIINTFEKAHFS